MGQKPQLHSSQMASFFRCGEAFRRRYIENEIIPPGVALIVGGSVHKAVQKDLGAKIETGKLLETEAVKSAAADAVAEMWDKSGCELTSEEKEAGLPAVRGRSIDRAIAFAAFHHETVAPELRPKFVERPWVLALEGFSHDLAGTIDVQEAPKDSIEDAVATIAHGKKIEAKKLDFTGSIRDVKTRAKTPPADTAHNSDQLTMYALACKVLDGVMPETLVLDNIIQTPKLGQLKYVPQITTRGEEDVQMLFRRIEVVVQAIEKGVFLPAPRDSWVCSEKFCGYAPTCPFFRRKVTTGFSGDGET